jgi:hypothetical protein
VILFRMVGMLFRLFVWNSNRELRRRIIILSPPRNSRTTVILGFGTTDLCLVAQIT